LQTTNPQRDDEWLTLANINSAPRIIRKLVKVIEAGVLREGATLAYVNAHLLEPIAGEDAANGRAVDAAIDKATVDADLEREWAERFSNTPKVRVAKRVTDEY
jgi:hypothetical protein